VTAQGYQRGRETFAKITSGNFEIVLGFALGASSMPVKWNGRVFWLRFFEDKINRTSEDPRQETESGRPLPAVSSRRVESCRTRHDFKLVHAVTTLVRRSHAIVRLQIIPDSLRGCGFPVINSAMSRAPIRGTDHGADA
jgi:hypothetical protein